ncbi:MAG: cytochrome P450 [Sciscionella sp.]|nr:cytochrome P450 [Sciscionella sp.]
MRAQKTAATLVERLPQRTRPLADPPAGSGLKPVLGNPGPPGIGYSLSIMTNSLEFARERYARLGPVQWSTALGLRVVTLLGPEAIGVALVNKDKAFANGSGGAWEYFIGPFFRRGIMLLDFAEHHHHRRIMQQAFTAERLVGYLGVLNDGIAAGLANWRPSERFPLYTKAKRLTLDLASEVFVGERVGRDAAALSRAFVATVHGGMSLIRADVPGGSWHRGLRGRRVLQEYFRARLPAKRAGDGPDLFTALCHATTDDGQSFSDDDVVNHMIFVLMAAHDTSTITLSMMAYFLGKHARWQRRLREESLALDKPAIDYADLDRLPAMDLVMKETMRMYAPVGGIARATVKDTDVLGHYVPAGTTINLALYPSMRLPDWWADPDTFDPERFSPERAEDKVHRFAWLPFGGGAHKCIGMHFGAMEVKAILHQMLLRYSWEVPDDYVMPLGYGTGPLPADGLPIELRESPESRAR